MDIPGLQFFLERFVRRKAAIDPVLPLDQKTVLETKRILVAVTTGMGDLILASPVIASLKAAFPEAKIALYCRKEWAPLFTKDPRVNEVIVYFGKSRRFFPTIRALRSFSPELVVAPHINDPDVLPMLYLSGARHIVRVPWGTTRFPELLSNRGIEEQRNSPPGLHVIDERLRVIEALGLAVATRVPQVFADPDKGAELRVHIEKLTGCAQYAVLHIFSADAYRTIPAALASACLKSFRQKYPDLAWVLTGSNQDRPALFKIAEGLGDAVWVAAGALSIDQSAACLLGAQGVIAPDTGTLHLAAALDRPLLALLSPTKEAPTREQVVGPRTASAPTLVLEVPSVCDPCVGRRCPYRPVKCLEAFEADDIVRAFGQLLESGARTQ